MKTIRMAPIIVLLLGIVGLGVGGAFVGIGFSPRIIKSQPIYARKSYIRTFGCRHCEGKVVDSLSTEKRSSKLLTNTPAELAPTYNDLLGGKPFDPTNLTQLKYEQAMNLQTNIYTAVLAFGLAQSIIAMAHLCLRPALPLLLCR